MTAAAIYVAANLSWFEIDQEQAAYYAVDVQSDGRWYRRLDLAWYGALHRATAKAKAEALSGRLSPEIWERYRQDFAHIWRWATAHWSPTEVRAAEAHRPVTYRLPGQPESVENPHIQRPNPLRDSRRSQPRQATIA